MPVSKSSLTRLKVPALQRKLTTAGLDVTGLKDQLVDRLYDYFAENPTKSLEDLSDSEDDIEVDTPVTITELAEQLKLSQTTVDALNKEAFNTVEDLEFFKTQNAGSAMADIVKATCDRLKLSAYLFPVSGTAKALPDNLTITASTNGRTVSEREEPSITRRDHSVKRRRPTESTSKRRSHTPSSSDDDIQGEYVSTKGENSHFGVLSNEDMPLEARHLPRPHTFVMAKARLGTDGKSKSKLAATDLTFDEFMVGSLQLASALGRSPKHRETLAEYLEYLHFLAIRRKDYLMASVLEFDDEYRRQMAFYNTSFTDHSLRSQVGDQFFNPKNLYTAPSPHIFMGYSRGYSNKPADRQGPRDMGKSNGHNSRPQYCNRYNNKDDCPYGAKSCQYTHACRRCGGKHRISNCDGSGN